MTDAQMITLAVAILAIFGATLFNNSRITDLRDSVNRRLDDHRNSLTARFDDQSVSINRQFESVHRHIDDKFALLTQQMKTMEENIMRVLGDHETRLQKLERG